MATTRTARDRRYVLWTGIILGIGIAGTLDEVVLHQLLQWHNLYVHAGERWRIVSDGLFHLFSSAMLVLAVWRLWRGRGELRPPRSGRTLVAGTLIGAGGFNLYDGTIQHWVLQLHPVREGVDNIWLYDAVFIGIALLALANGIRLLRTTPRVASTSGEPIELRVRRRRDPA